MVFHVNDVTTNLTEEQPSFCNNLNAEDFNESKGIPNSRIIIIATVEKQEHYDDYMIALNSTKCYASHFGYSIQLLNVTDKPIYQKQCKHPDFFFKRHCILGIFMKEHIKDYDFILYIDADMGIINPCHRIQDYIDKSQSIEMIFYERYFNYEFAAGSFLIRNTQFSRSFLKYWADYNYRLPDSFHGTDNGAIHQVLMELHFFDPKDKFQCFHLWNISKGYDDLFAYEACTKHALYSNSVNFINNKVKILPKMDQQRWVRDTWLTDTKWSSKDFMFHGWKISLSLDTFMYPFLDKFDLTKCQHGDNKFENFKYVPELVRSDEEIHEILLNKTLFVHAKYNNLLKYLNITCKNGFRRVNGECNGY
uniref:Nucleotide-diphospho-sugar transferase domain-containing protein n=1 Tax=Panagrolaimus davidi TaxID=227884 RepID=A0A914QFJ7_9BILA